MMRWGILANIIFAISTNVFSQTYIIKFKSVIVDTNAVRSVILQYIAPGKSKTNSMEAFSITPLSQSSVSTRSGFQWKQYSIVHFSKKQSDQFLQTIAALPSVEYIQPNVIYHINTVPNDSASSSQWNLQRIGITALWNNGTIRSTLPAVKVGVIDTGIDDAHPDLATSIALNSGETGNGRETNGIDDDGNGFIDDWKGYDFVDGESEDAGDWKMRDNDPKDEHGHGTAVSGIIGAQTNNGIGMMGIVPAKILPLRAFGKNGSGNDIDIASAIVYAADNGTDVINMSFGDVIQSLILHDAIRYAYSKNIVLVASSGNDGSNYPHYPSDFSEVISTGSVNRFDSRSIFSSNSPSLDLMAPGEEIVTTTIGGGYTSQFSGTSAAAPHVSGVAALLKSLEKQKKTINPNYSEFSNEEIKGILLNTADDLGEKGWDKFYGAGIINASRAIQSVSGSQVVIHSPSLDEIITSNTVPIIVTAQSPYLQSIHLQYGIGENPVQWTTIKSIENTLFSRDTITQWDVSLLQSNIYILRLIVKNSKANDLEFRQRVELNSSLPRILTFRLRDSVIIGNEYGALIEAFIDRNSSGTLYFRKIGELQYKTIKSLGVQLHHSFTLSAKDLVPLAQYEFYCQFTENSARKNSVRFPTTALAGFEHFSVSVGGQKIASTGFEKKQYSLPKGFLLNAVQNIGQKPTLVLNEYSSDNNFGKLKSFQFANGNFIVKDSSDKSWVPRAFTKSKIGENPLILVQDRGVSQLLQIDTINSRYLNQPIWGDSTDVWASQMADLDGDNIPEIIARNSFEYLIYKNNGNNKFTVQSRLSNTSRPLTGEARNQFGPPRSIIGDFSITGKKEIIFADYDGDVIVYRQTAVNSLQFELVRIDTSDLYEMSDYLTTGDFNGDGILDYAVAGHSNLDWNQEREYDVPIWTVRVFSHKSTDAIGTVSKIWEQHFVGVKAGSGYDNGLMSGKLRSNDPNDALMISFNPQVYIFEWNSLQNTFEANWNHSSQSNSIIVYDFDGDAMNDLGFCTEGKTEFWSLPSNTNNVIPFGLTAIPIAATKIHLRWGSKGGSHTIFRGIRTDSLSILGTTNEKQWIDSSVALNRKYYYAVKAVSNLSTSEFPVVSVITHIPPKIDSVVQVSYNQLAVQLSFDLSSSNNLTTMFVIDSSITSSSSVWKSSRSLLVTFPQNLAAGSHLMKIRQLTDASGMAGDTTHSVIVTISPLQPKEFFVQSIKLLSSQKIQLEFSEQPEFRSVLNPLYYSISTIAKQYHVVSVDSLSLTTIVLNVAPGSNLSELALRLEVVLNENITSSTGRKLKDGKGQILSIAQETRSIENVVVYPNPANGEQQVSFVNIPENCRITVFSVNGERIKQLENVTTNEGTSWNRRDAFGNIVPTGVYFYRIEQLNSSNEVSGTKLGKFAVIR